MDFLRWYRSWHEKHPDVSVQEARQVYEKERMEYLKWMYELGWSPEDVMKIPESRRMALAAPSCVEVNKANAACLLELFPREDVLELLERFPCWFIVEPEVFRSRWGDVAQLLREGWQQTVMAQCREKTRDNVVEAMMFATDIEWLDALERLQLYALGIHGIDA